MSSHRMALLTTLTIVLLSTALAENAFAQVPVRTGPSTATGTTTRPRQEPCWQVAGISKSAMQQRREITQQTRQAVEAVCADSSLSAQQKREQIKQIRQREREQVEAIITPEQQEALRSCQRERSTAQSGVNGGHHAGAGGPCGEMPTGSKPDAQHNEDEAPPDETPQPH